MALGGNGAAGASGGSIGPENRSRPPSLFNQLFSGSGNKGTQDSVTAATPGSSRRNSVASSIYKPEVRLSTSSLSIGQNTKQPPSPSTNSLKYEPPPNHDLIDQFEGLDFDTLIDHLSAPPAPKTIPEDCEIPPHETPEARIATLAETSKDLLARVYDAYKKRTKAAGDALGEASALKDELEGSKLRNRILQSQIEKLEAKFAAELAAKDEALQMMQDKISRLEVQMADAMSTAPPSPSDDEIPTPRANSTTGQQEQQKRISSSTTSDSGFESDADSLFSRTTSPSETTTLSPSESTLNLSVNTCPTCSSHLPIRPTAPSPTSLRAPTPLRESITPNQINTSSPSSTTPTHVTPAQSKWAAALQATFRGRSLPAEQGEVEGLRSENRFLRTRVGELEVAVEGALGVLGGWRT